MTTTPDAPCLSRTDLAPRGACGSYNGSTACSKFRVGYTPCVLRNDGECRRGMAVPLPPCPVTGSGIKYGAGWTQGGHWSASLGAPQTGSTTAERPDPTAQRVSQEDADWLQSLAIPPLPPVARSSASTWVAVINVGLPRSGTTSFALASAMVGMRTVHSWCRSYPHWADSCPFEAPTYSLRAYDSLSDTPFFLVPRADFEAASSAAARFVCTVREKHAWVRSIVEGHGSAGGPVLRMFLEHELRMPVHRCARARHTCYMMCILSCILHVLILEHELRTCAASSRGPSTRPR